MAPTPDSSTIPFTRRRVIGWGGAGAIAGLASFWGWKHHSTETAIEASLASASLFVAKNAPEPSADPSFAESSVPAPGVRREDFLPHLKSEFQLDSGTRCRLVEVGPAQKLVSPTAEFTSFSLLFTAPSDFAAESKIYHLSHGRMIAINLFVSPVGRSKDHVHLEAVCSQRV